jgi:hypothetical protein
MESQPLGSWRSWLLDSALVGATVPPTVLGVLFLMLSALQGGLGSGAFLALTVSAVLGLGIGLLVGPVAWGAASRAWSRPLLALALGPALGTLAAGATLFLLSWAVDGRSPSLGMEKWLIVLGLGAFAIGPPWVAYVAVRSRGRSGTPVVPATLCWAAGSTAIAVGMTWLRHRYGWFL